MRRRSHNRIGAVAAIAVALGFASLPDFAHARKDKDDKAEVQVDYVELASLLMRDGHLDRADATLRQVDLKAEGTDVRRYWELTGLLALKQKRWPEAAAAFKKAISLGEVRPVVHLYLAQTQFELKEFGQCIASLKKAGEAATSRPAAYLMWSEAYFEQGKPQDGFRVLWKARKQHPRERSLQRAIIFHLVEAKLFQEAIDVGADYLKGADSAADFVALGEALRQAGQLHQSQQVLELGQLRFPDDERAILALTHVYVDEDHNLAGAMLLERVARFKPELALETAELYRRAGRHERALLWNTRIPDQKKKLRQRLAVLVEMERYGMVAAMEPRLSRLELLDEENVRYALAYGLFKLGSFDRAEQHLRQLKTAEMFERANQLRKAMEDCREQGWQCS